MRNAKAEHVSRSKKKKCQRSVPHQGL